MQSHHYKSPSTHCRISRAGVRQAESVREFIKNNKNTKGKPAVHADVSADGMFLLHPLSLSHAHPLIFFPSFFLLKVLSAESEQKSIIVCSNLRRCISTALIGPLECRCR